MATIKNFPNNSDEFIGAEPVMRWLHGRTSGVFGAANNLAVSAVTGEMAVTVSDGVGWMANSEANGSVFWNDTNEVNGSPLQLSVDIADAVFPRIDRVVVSWQTVDYVAKPTIAVLKGTASSTPVAPTLTNTNLMRKISLAKISVPAGTSAITASLITDERLDTTVCGIVTESVSVDTSMMQAQFEDWFRRMKGQLSTDAAGHLQNEIDAETARAESMEARLATVTVSLPASGWTGTAAPYTQTVSVPGMTADWVPGIPMLTSSGVVETDLAMREALSCVSLIESSAGALTFACYEDKPTTDINVKIPGVM